jgi:hypothetical protein
MGVDKTDYIMFGYKLDYEMEDPKGGKIDWYSDKFLPMIKGRKGEEYSLIIDGMNGDYVVFGKILLEGNEYEGFDFKEFDVSKINSESVKRRLQELFEDYREVTDEPKLFAFSHFS